MESLKKDKIIDCFATLAMTESRTMTESSAMRKSGYLKRIEILRNHKGGKALWKIAERQSFKS